MPDFYCQTLDWGFSLRKSIFVENCSFSYFHVFAREPINTQESLCEKNHLVTIYLLEKIFIFRIILNICGS